MKRSYPLNSYRFVSWFAEGLKLSPDYASYIFHLYSFIRNVSPLVASFCLSDSPRLAVSERLTPFRQLSSFLLSKPQTQVLLVTSCLTHTGPAEFEVVRRLRWMPQMCYDSIPYSSVSLYRNIVTAWYFAYCNEFNWPCKAVPTDSATTPTSLNQSRKCCFLAIIIHTGLTFHYAISEVTSTWKDHNSVLSHVWQYSKIVAFAANQILLLRLSSLNPFCLLWSTLRFHGIVTS